MKIKYTTALTPLRRILLCALLFAAPAMVTAAPAPAFSLPDSAGDAVTLAQQQGKLVYLDFWASWCGPCRQSFPWMNEMLAKYRDKGLVIIGVNLDANPADADKFLAKTPAQFTVVYDNSGATPTAYGVKGMPTSFLIDQNGQILSQHAGFNASQKADLEAAIQQALEALR